MYQNERDVGGDFFSCRSCDIYSQWHRRKMNCFGKRNVIFGQVGRYINLRNKKFSQLSKVKKVNVELEKLEKKLI